MANDRDAVAAAMASGELAQQTFEKIFDPMKTGKITKRAFNVDWSCPRCDTTTRFDARGFDPLTAVCGDCAVPFVDVLNDARREATP